MMKIADNYISRKNYRLNSVCAAPPTRLGIWSTVQSTSPFGFFGELAQDAALHSSGSAIAKRWDTLNIVYAEQEKRSFLKLNVVSLTFTVAGILFAPLAIGAVVVLPVALKYLGLSDEADLLLRIGRWPALFIALTLTLAFHLPFRAEEI
jgi:membrane protein